MMSRLWLGVLLVLSYLCKFVVYRGILLLDSGLNIESKIAAYLTCFAVAASLAAIILVNHKKILSMILMFVIDLWLVANILYYEANHLYITWQVALTFNQLRGFEDSINGYVNWSIIVISLVSIIIVYIISLFPLSAKKYWKAFCLVLIFSFCSCLLAWGLRNSHLTQANDTHQPLRGKTIQFVKTHSPIAHMAYVCYFSIKKSAWKSSMEKPLNKKELSVLSTIYRELTHGHVPQGHLVCILIESLESWPLYINDIENKPVCPNLTKYILNNNVLYCDKITSQQLYGRSGDGQLITQTGMLPVSHGITCMQYGNNVYPNFAHFYPNSIVLNPYPGVWNQKTTTYSYGYKNLRELPRMLHCLKDSIILSMTISTLEQAKVPTCVLAITIDTHVPFHSSNNSLILSGSYSEIERKYLKCVHDLDRHMGTFLHWADTSKIMQDATIVITADHNHFPQEDGKGFCPLMIKSPHIHSKIDVKEAYQMDIFPTVLHAIGQANYAWHGFGVDLLDSTSTRHITPSVAYSLSEKMIYSNFFQSHPLDAINP